MTREQIDDLVSRLRERARIRRQIPSRKSVQEGQPDRISDLLEEAAAALSERVWVPVSERLPKDHVRVLVRGYGNVFVAGHVTERARWEIVNDAWIADSEATHWMPLPEPPLAAAEGEGK